MSPLLNHYASLSLTTNNNNDLNSNQHVVSPLTMSNTKINNNINIDNHKSLNDNEIEVSTDNNKLSGLLLTNMPTTTIISTPTTSQSTIKPENQKNVDSICQSESDRLHFQQQHKSTLATISTNGSRIKMISSVKI